MDGAGIKQEEGIGGHPPLFPQPHCDEQIIMRAIGHGFLAVSWLVMLNLLLDLVFILDEAGLATIPAPPAQGPPSSTITMHAFMDKILPLLYLSTYRRHHRGIRPSPQASIVST
jgi:hypothetical protein